MLIHYRQLILRLVCMLMLPACNKPGFFENSGEMTTRSRSLPAVHEVVLYDKVNLVLTQDSAESVEVETGKNLQDGIETSAIGNRLIIRDNNKYKWMRNLSAIPTVYIHSNAFRAVTYFGAGNITTTNTLIAESFSIDSWTGTGSLKLRLNASRTDVTIRNGNADLVLQGKTGFNQVYCADQGKLDLRNFITGDLVIDYRSIQDSYVQATNLLSARIHYKGNLYYTGQPVGIQLIQDNTGRLIRL